MVREYANRVKENTRRRRSKQEVLALSVELGPEKVHEEYARLRESWPGRSLQTRSPVDGLVGVGPAAGLSCGCNGHW